MWRGWSVGRRKLRQLLTRTHTASHPASFPFLFGVSCRRRRRRGRGGGGLFLLPNNRFSNFLFPFLHLHFFGCSGWRSGEIVGPGHASLGIPFLSIPRNVSFPHPPQKMPKNSVKRKKRNVSIFSRRPIADPTVVRSREIFLLPPSLPFVINGEREVSQTKIMA